MRSNKPNLCIDDPPEHLQPMHKLTMTPMSPTYVYVDDASKLPEFKSILQYSTRMVTTRMIAAFSSGGRLPERLPPKIKPHFSLKIKTFSQRNKAFN